VDRLRRKIRGAVAHGDLEGARASFCAWQALLDELLAGPHQDAVNARRGMRNCLWLQSPNVTDVREDETLKAKKEAAKASRAK